MPRKLIAIIYANGGSGKSFLGLALSKKLIANPVIKKVVYIDLDNLLNVLVERNIEGLICPKLSYIHRSSLDGITAMDLIQKIVEGALGDALKGVVCA